MPIAVAAKARPSSVRRALMGSTALGGLRRAALAGSLGLALVAASGRSATAQSTYDAASKLDLTDSQLTTYSTLSNSGGDAYVTVNVQTTSSYSGSIQDGTGRLGLTIVSQSEAGYGLGVLTLTGANTYTLGTTIESGTLRLGPGGSLSPAAGLVVNGGTFDLNGISQTVASLNGVGGIIKLGTGTLTVAGGGSFEGAIGGEGGLTKSGSGTFVLTRIGSYTGATTVSGGTFKLDTGGTLSAATALVVNGGTFDINGISQTVAGLDGTGGTIALGSGTLTVTGGGSFAGSISGSGGLTKSGTGTLMLTGAGTYGGLTTVSAGTLVAGHATALGTTAGGATVSSGATLQIANVAVGTEALSLAGTGVGGVGALVGTGAASAGGAILLTANTTIGVTGTTDSLTLSGVVGGGFMLTKVGLGTLVLSGTNVFSSGTTLNTGTIQVRSSGALGSGALSMGNGTILQSGAAGLALPNAIALTTAGAVDTNGNTLTLSGVISGSGAVLTKSGTGTLTLGSANTYGGGTTLNVGTIVLGNNGALGSGALTMGNGTTLQSGADNLVLSNAITLTTAGTIFTNGNTMTLSGVIGGGSSVLTKSGGGTLVLTGTNTYSGGTNLSTGTLQVGSNGALGSGALTMASGTVLQSGAANLSLSNAITLTTAGAIDTSGNTLTLSGVIGGVGAALAKSGAGTLVLTGTNTYSGGTTLSTGTLQVGSNGALGSGALVMGNGTILQSGAANLTLSNAIALTTAGTIFTNGNTLTLSGVIGGSGAALTKSGSGTLVLTGANTYGGGTTLSFGTLQVGSNGALGSGALTMASGTILQSAAANLALSNAITLTTAGTIDTNGSTLTLSGVIGGASSVLTKSGIGTLVLAGANTYSGGTVLSTGTLQVGSSGALGSGALTMASGTILQSGAANLALSNAIALSTAGTIFTNGNTLTLSGVIGGGSSVLTKSGAGILVLTGTNTYSGGTTLSTGTLQVGSNGALGSGALTMASGTILQSGAVGLSLPNAITLATAGTIDTNGNTLTLSGVIGGPSAALTKSGAGTLVLTGTNTYGGGTVVTQGSLQVGNGGASGVIAGNVSISSNSTLSFNRSDSITFAGVMTGQGSVTKAGTGTLTLTGNNSAFAGGIVVSQGVVAVGSAAALGADTGDTASRNSIVLDGGSLLATETFETGVNVVLNKSDSTINVTAGKVLTLSGAVSGSGLIVGGAGTLRLTGSNSVTGIAFGQSIVEIGSSGALSGAVSLSGTTLAFVADDITVSANLSIGALGATVGTGARTATLAGAIGGSGGLTKTGTGTLVLSPTAGTNGFGGTTSVNEGTLRAGNERAFSSASLLSVAETGVVELSGFSNTVGGLAGRGTVRNGSTTKATLTVNVAGAAEQTFAGVLADGAAGSLSLTKTGTGVQVLSGTSNAYSGTTLVSEGTLRLSADGALPSGTRLEVAAGASFELNGKSQRVAGLGISGSADTAVPAGGTVSLGGGTLTVSVTDDMLLFGGTITGSGTFVKTGTGLQVLGRSTEATDTFATQITDGTLVLGSDNAIGRGLLTIGTSGYLALYGRNATVAGLTGQGSVGNEANTGSTLTLAVASDTTYTFSGQIQDAQFDGTGSLSLTKTGAGVQILSGTSGFTGTTIVAEGTLRAGSTQGFSSASLLSVATGAFAELNGFDNAAAGLSGAGTVRNAGTRAATLTVSVAGTQAFSGLLEDGAPASGAAAPLSLTKMGGGVQILSGAGNTYSGTTLVSAGILRAGSTGGFSAASLLSVSAGAFAELGGFAGTVSGLDGAGTVRNAGKAAAMLTLATASGVSQTFAGTLADGDGAGALSLTKTGSGTQVLTGASTYTGGTTIAAGVLAVGDGAALGTGSVSLLGGATLSRSGSESATALENGLTLVPTGSDTSGFVAVTSGQITLNGLVSGDGGLVKTGSGTLVLANAANSFAGGVSVEGGTLSIGSAGALGSGAPLRLDGGRLLATADFTVGSANGAFAKSLLLGKGGGTVDTGGYGFTLATSLGSRPNPFTKAGAGTLTLAADSTSYGGAITVDGGILMVASGVTVGDGSATVTVASGATLAGKGTIGGNVSVGAGGTLSTGASPGTLAITGNLTLASGSTSRFELGSPGYVGSNQTVANDLVTVGGMLTLGGTLVVGKGIAPGYYRLFNYASLSSGSAFASITDSSGSSLAAQATVMAGTVPGQVNLLYTAGNESVLFFDGTDTTGNTGSTPGDSAPQGGTATWSSAGTNWTTAPTLGAASTGSDVNSVWASGYAVFGGTTTGTKTVTVRRGDEIAIKGIQFASDGYVIAGEAPQDGRISRLMLASDGSSATAPKSAVTVDEGVSATIGVTLADGGAGIGLRKLGSGTLVLTGANTYTGGTTVEKGTLAVESQAALGTGAASLTLGAGAVLRADAGMALANPVVLGLGVAGSLGTATIAVDPAGRTLTLDGGVGQAANGQAMALVKVGAGTLALNGAGSYTGGTTLAAGTIAVGHAAALGTGLLTMADGTTLQAGAAGLTLNNAVAIASGGSATVDTAGRSISLAGVVSGGGLMASGGGTLTLANASTATPNSFAGLTIGKDTTVVNNGVLTGTITLNGGTLKAGVVQTLDNTINLGADGGTLDGTSFALTFNGSLTGNGKLSTLGKVLLKGDALSSYSGDIDVTGPLENGPLEIAAGSSFGKGAAQVVTVADGAGLKVNGSVSATVKVSGQLSGSGTITGTVNVAQGGTLSAGNSPGTLTIVGSLTLAAGSNSVFELGAPGKVGGTSNDLVAVNGDLAIDPTATVTLAGTVTSGYYRLINYTGTRTGAFDTTVNGVASGAAAQIYYIDKQVNLLYTAGSQSVLFFAGNTAGNTGNVPSGALQPGNAGVWSAAAVVPASGTTQWTTAPNSGGTAPATGTATTSPGSDVNDGWRKGVAVFKGDAPGTVSVDNAAGAIEVEGIQFVTSGYVVKDGKLTLAGNSSGNAAASFIRTESGVRATIGSTLTGSKGLDILGSGTLVLNGANDYVGATSITGGVVVAGHSAAFGAAGNAVAMSDGTTLQAGAAGVSLGQAFTLAGTATVDTAGLGLELKGTVSGSASTTLQKTGAGTLTLSGDGSGFGGIVQVKEGSLTVTASGKLTATSLTVATGTGLSNQGRLVATGNTITNSGTLTSSGTLVDASQIVNNDGATIAASGVLTAPKVDNKGTFTVIGALSGKDPTAGSPFAGPITTFQNSGTLAVGANAFTGVATVQNAKAVTVGTGGRLGSGTTGAVAYTQTSGSTVNAGTLEFPTVTISGGTFSSTGTVTAATAFVASADTSLAGTLNTARLTNTANLTVTGALGGAIAAFDNAGTLVLGGNSVSGIGTLTNAGTISGGGTLAGVTLAGTGIIDLRPSGSAGLAQDASLSLTIGQLSGNQTVKVALDPVGGTAGKVVATGGSTAGSSLTFLITQTSLRPTAAPITLAQGLGSGTTVAAKSDQGYAFDVGFISTRLTNPYTGLWQVTTTVSPNAGAPAASIGSVITSLSTGFFSSTNAFVTSPSDSSPNSTHGGPWVRIQAGQYDTQSATTVSFGSLSTSSQTKVRTSFSGFQVGADYGVLNVGGSGVNLHAGVMAGSVGANGAQRDSATPTKGTFSVPFAGAYAALVAGSFSADLQYRRDLYSMDLTNPVGFTGTLANQKADGQSVNGSATYRVGLDDTMFLEPSVGFNYTRVEVDPFKAAQGNASGVKGGSLTLKPVESLLGRASLRAGFTTVIDDRFVVQPFVTAAVWHEFAEAQDSTFTFSDTGDRVKITSGRVGTFGQAGLGVTSQIVGTSLLGYIRTDARFGDRIRGGSVNMGVRYDF